MEERQKLSRYAWLSVIAAVATISLKTTAYLVTGSVGLLSDAVESLINLAAALLTLFVIRIGERPPDEQHAHGHEKAEYFSMGAEGGMILIAAVGIAALAIERLLHPRPISRIDLGLIVCGVASLINLVVSRVILKAGRRNRSVALEADAQHLMTDVWTSAGVIAGVGLVALTHWQPLDPLIAVGVAAQIAWMGVRLVTRSVRGLMDVSLPAADVDKVLNVLEENVSDEIQYHALRTRQSGARSFISVHIQVPGEWSVQKGHDLAERIEGGIRTALPFVSVFTHIEPREDPLSFADEYLDPLESKAKHVKAKSGTRKA